MSFYAGIAVYKRKAMTYERHNNLLDRHEERDGMRNLCSKTDIILSRLYQVIN